MKPPHILFFALLVFAGCGGNEATPSGEIVFEEAAGDVGYIHLNLSNTKNINISELGTITQYKIRIEGEGFEPKEKILSKESKGVALSGIPVGKKRRVQVFALNRENQILREGLVEGVAIEIGKSLDLEIALEAVPLVVNRREGDFLSNGRLFFHVLTDPKRRIAIRGESFFHDILSGKESAESDDQGLAKFFPGTIPPGDHSFEIVDVDSGKSSKILLHLWEGQAVRPAPLWAGGSEKSVLGGVR